MTDTFTQISALVQHQFPAFYKEQGPEFVLFVQSYYEWMEQSGNLIDTNRRLFDITDIDRTLQQYLTHFKQKYMHGLPVEVLGNQRLFQKHILELYRAKGSIAGLKLLFRLLYNENVNVYVPSYDIFKGSDGVWERPNYLEVEFNPYFWGFTDKQITGSISGATAIVETVHKKHIGNRHAFIVYLSNISGTFRNDETIVYPGLSAGNGLHIIGSPREVTVTSTYPGYAVGDVVVNRDTPLAPMKAVVTSVYNSLGAMAFKLVNGGTYYSMDAVISITPGTNTSGSDASFIIGELSNTSTFVYNSDALIDYANTDIDAVAYNFPAEPTANSNSFMLSSLTISNVQVGTISSIITTNPGQFYDGSVTVSVIDPYTPTAGFVAEDGTIGGTNAVVTGLADFGIGLIRTVRVIDSGFGYNANNISLQLESESNAFVIADAIVELDGMGIGEGYYSDTKGFASDDKYLYDGYYYQNFSYEVKTTKALEQFVDILKQTVHSAGNIVFGRAVLRETNKIEITDVGQGAVVL